jgi:hypothetical protein
MRRGNLTAAAVLTTAAVFAVMFAACGASDLTAASSCRDYADASRDEQTAVAQNVAQDEQVAYSPLVQANVDAKCSVSPDKSIAWAVTGRTSAETAVDTDSDTADTEATPEPVKLTVNSTCDEFNGSSEAAQDEFASRLLHRRVLYDNEDSSNSFYSQPYPDEAEIEPEVTRTGEYIGTVCGGTGDVGGMTLKDVARTYGVPVP